MRRLACTIVCGALLAALGPAAGSAAALPPIKHVFIVVLENEDASSTFGANTDAPYLAQTLRARGGYIPGYFATGHLSLDNYISMVSGQGPNPYTQADAPVYADFLPGAPGPNGQYIGQGSVYPAAVKTIADQLEAKGRTWGGYMEDMGNDPSRDGAFCNHGHPAVNSQDHSQQASVGDQYAMRHNPFMYFHSIIDNDARCKAHVFPLTKLPGALAGGTPNYVFITPNLCHDGHDGPCVNKEPGGLKSANAFLKQWIPKILGSSAYRQGGLVIITFDEAENHDASACCGEMTGPNTPNNGGPQPGAGGGKVGAVLLSPYIRPGTQTKQEYNHYSLLRSIEDMFGVSHLGYAGASGPRSFGSDIFTNPTGRKRKPIPRPRVRFNNVPAHGCVSGDWRLSVRTNAFPPRTVVVKLDGRRVATSHKSRFGLTIHSGPLKAGRHKLLAVATDRFGRRATRMRTFSRC